MLDVDVPLVKRNGTVERLTGLPRVAAELYRAARRLRVFVLERVALEPKRIVELVMLPREEVARRGETGRGLLSPGWSPRPGSPAPRPRLRGPLRVAARGARRNDPPHERREVFGP